MKKEVLIRSSFVLKRSSTGSIRSAKRSLASRSIAPNATITSTIRSAKRIYQLFAFLNSDDEPQLEVPSAEQQAKRAAVLKTIAEIEDRLLSSTNDFHERMAGWETEMKELERDWTVLDPSAYYGAVGTKFTKLKDGSLLATASSPPVSGYTINVRTKMTNSPASVWKFFAIRTCR